MSFYLATKGNVQPFYFKYLSSSSEKRLEKTRILGQANEEQTSPSSIQKIGFTIEIMSTKIISASPATTLKDAIQACQKSQIHHLPVIVDHVIVGFLSDRDILQHLHTKHYLHEIMSDTILLCSENTSVTNLAEVMIKENISALPVINQHLKLTGIVTHRDILKWIIEKGYIEK